MKTFGYVAATLAATSLTVTPVFAYPASNLRDLVGAGAGQAEMQLEQRGFTYIDGSKDYNGAHTYWWHDKDDNCIHVVTNNGRYTSITDASRKDCHRSNGGDAALAVGAVAGVAILGALLSGGHKKHHHQDNRHYENVNDEAHYERGYDDGLHNAAYHNYDRSNAYSDGYQAGVAQRERNTSHHHRRGGYHRAAQFKDLQGQRARNIDDLGRRGFRQVDNFTSGNTRYAIWWRGESRQCLQATIADGRIYDIRDIGRHPQCR